MRRTGGALREEIFEEPPLGLTPADETIAPAADAIAGKLDAASAAREADGADEPVFGLLGRRLGHSWSPRIHSLLGSSPYGLFEREPDEVEGFLREGPWRGINVTIPYKREALALADEASDTCRRVGAANTLIRRDDGSIYADNTDVRGFRWLLERFCARAFDAEPEAVLAGREALVLGSGGASVALRAVLEAAGMSVAIISRRGPEGYDTLLERHGDAALVVNATPVGMYPACPASPLAETVLAGLSGLRGVIDIIYNPARTGLILRAERLGLPVAGGLAMLVGQAFASSELFQGKGLSEDLLELTLGTLERETRDIFFIGMPGCGKTGCARRLAHLVGRPFVDLDDAFTVECGISPADYIVEHGEAAFRKVETERLAETAKGTGLVVACGGGVVERPENLDLLRENGYVVFLERPLEELARDGRPITAAHGVEALAARRMGWYREWADLEIACTGTAEGDALLVKELLGL